MSIDSMVSVYGQYACLADEVMTAVALQCLLKFKQVACICISILQSVMLCKIDVGKFWLRNISAS